jgi:5-methyltetrahydrofolate--homocysteine methyltransferase
MEFMPNQLLHRLAEGVLLCDGGMGTQLMARGMKSGECSERWNVDRPGDVMSIHRAYVQAGCQLITTNTFGGTRASLARHGLDAQTRAINAAAVQLAREAAQDRALVLGNIGPFGDFLEPLGQTTPEQAFELFREQAAALCDAGAHAAIIETMSDPAEMTQAILAARQAGDWAVIATYAFCESGDGKFRTMMGTTVDEAMQAAIDAGADVVGANCGTGLDLSDYIRLARAIVDAAGSTPAVLQPNAGTPHQVDGETRYAATPMDMAGIVPVLLDAGLRIIGGCCGTTPEHLRAMSQALRAIGDGPGRQNS